MAFFKETTATSSAKLKRIETWVWVLIYGGLLCSVLGLFMERTQGQDASAFFAVGGVAVAVGVVLVWVRSRLRDDKAP